MPRSALFVRVLIAVLLAGASCKGSEPRKTANVDLGTLKPGPIRRDELSQDLVARITKLHDSFDPSPLSKWLDDFKHDQNPESESEIYERMARAYAAFCRGRTLSLDRVPPQRKRSQAFAG